MTDREVRAYLRGATKEGMLDGWNTYQSYTNMGPKRFWTFTTALKQSRVFDDQGIRQYCVMIKEAGTEPVFIGKP